MSDEKPGADPDEVAGGNTPDAEVTLDEVAGGDALDAGAAAADLDQVAVDTVAVEADEAAAGDTGVADADAIDVLDEPTRGAHRAPALPNGEVAEGDEPGGESVLADPVEVDESPPGAQRDSSHSLGIGEVAGGDEPGAEPQYVEEVERAEEGPLLPGVLVLGVVGVLAGFVMVGLVWGSERGCDRVRDAPNCGAAGFPLLVLAVVVTVVLAAVALSRLGMPNPKLVAFLGVGFMLLVVLGFLSDDLFSTWTLLVVPVLTAITFLLADLIARRLERADA